MTAHEDRTGVELKAAERYTSFKGSDVLEVGCGDGRFTAKYLGEPKSLVAIDPDPDAIRIAKTKIPSKLSHRVSFRLGEAEKLGFSSGLFDVVIFSWSLCCVSDVKKSLKEACRVLRTGGSLVNIMPEAVPSFEMAMLRALGGKEVIRQGSLDAFRGLIEAVQNGMLLPFYDQRILFDTFFDSIDDLVKWLPTAPGPLNRDEFESLSKRSLGLIKKFAATLKNDRSLRVRDILIISTAVKPAP